MSGDYDGFNFGRSTRVEMVQNPSEAQINRFFGMNGRMRLHGGGRGRVFEVHSLFWGYDESGVYALRDLLNSYDDGIGRILYESYAPSIPWPMVIFIEQRWDGPFTWGHGGALRAYVAHFEGLI